MTIIKTGERIPKVVLASTSGKNVDLQDACSNHHVVLFFYPGDGEGVRYPELAGCTQEACSFRNQLASVQGQKAIVYGVSLQSTERQKEFVLREHLNFELLSDQREELIRQLSLPVLESEAGERFVKRTTVLIQKGGRIAHIFKDIDVKIHVDEVVRYLKELNSMTRNLLTP